MSTSGNTASNAVAQTNPFQPLMSDISKQLGYFGSRPGINRHNMAALFLLLFAQADGHTAERRMTNGTARISASDVMAAPGWNAWADVDPFAFLELLKTTPGVALYLQAAPAGWVKPEHLERLLGLVDSLETASGTCFIASAHMVPRGFRSTVGLEAARMLEAYRLRRSYPGACSDLDRVDVRALKQWSRSRRAP